MIHWRCDNCCAVAYLSDREAPPGLGEIMRASEWVDGLTGEHPVAGSEIVCPHCRARLDPRLVVSEAA